MLQRSYSEVNQNKTFVYHVKKLIRQKERLGMYKKCRKIWNLTWPYFIFIGMSLFILKFQYTSKAMILSGDSMFHVNQFYESAMQIKTGHFSWFLTMFGFGQSGRVINAFYGPVFSYLIGGLTLLVGTWFRTQIILEFLVITMSGLFMYYLGRSIRFNQILSVALGCLYATSFPIVAFIHSQMFDGLGNMFIPLVIMLGIKMWRSGRINVLLLSTLIALTFQIHVLTTIIAIITLIPFAFVSFIISSHKYRWLRQLFVTIIIFLILTCNIWASMLDVFYKNRIIKPFPNMNIRRFSVFWNNNTFTLMNQALLVIIAITLILTLVTILKSNWRQRFIFVLAIFYTFLSSAYFPWNFVIKIIPAVSQFIQFPDRFLGVAIALILLTLGNSVELLLNYSGQIGSVFFKIIISIVAISALGSIKLEQVALNNQVVQLNNKSFFTVNSPTLQHLNINFGQISKAFNKSRKLDLGPEYIVKPMPDYLPSNQSLSPENYFKSHPYYRTMKELLRYNYVQNRVGRRQYTALIKSNPKPFYFKKWVNNQGLILRWHQPKALNHHKMTLPMVKYHHTRVMMDHHRINPSINQIGLIELSPRTGYHQIAIHYQAFNGFKLLMLVNAISWVCLLIVGIIKIKEKIRMKGNE